MSTAMVRSLLWRVVRRLHRLDFRHVLPWLARLPLPLAYALAGLRSRIMASTTLDWRSIALGYRHIRLQSLRGLRLLPAQVPDTTREAWCRQRFAVEAPRGVRGAPGDGPGASMNCPARSSATRWPRCGRDARAGWCC
jgi:hypothetical protein